MRINSLLLWKGPKFHLHIQVMRPKTLLGSFVLLKASGRSFLTMIYVLRNIGGTQAQLFAINDVKRVTHKKRICQIVGILLKRIILASLQFIKSFPIDTVKGKTID